MKGSDHPAFAILFADLLAEFLGDSRPNRRSGLNDDELALSHRGIDFIDLAVFG
jgi:hypothetical protein